MMDLPPSKDPKGGSPRTPPRGIPIRDYQHHVDEKVHSDHVASFWKTIALVLLTANISGIGSWLVFGRDTVHHSEIDQIMSTRAPYIHDRQRIQDFIDDTKRRLYDIETRHARESEQKN
jgi:hypothetical protein